MLGERPPCFFGVRVQPITLGHLRLLAELEVSLAVETFGDALLIASVCSQSHRDSRKDVVKWWFKHLLKWLAYRAGKRGDIKLEAKRFADWLNNQLEGPTRKFRVTVKEQPKGRLAAPLHLNLISGAMGTLGLSLAEAEALPVKLARQLLASYHESAGDLELWTDAEYAFDQWCKHADERKRNAPEMAGRN